MCTRVKAPTVSDYHKLGRTINYLRSTIFMPLVLGWDGNGVLTWSVNASFAIHNDMRSHTSAVISMGQGALMSMSSKQKINTKSSTEAELVGVEDAMNFAVWIKLFMGEQSKTVSSDSALSKFMHQSVILQDNTSTIQFEKNGKQSNTKRTRHINIRYFYVTSKVKNGDVRIVYCPTTEMVSDYLTKPLQGSLFRTRYKKICVHTIFDVKHDGRHKARVVANGNLTEASAESVYSGVVSLCGLHTCIFLGELNGMTLWATDIGNAYLEAKTTEKVCIKAGPTQFFLKNRKHAKF
jgi:hypothetical protein